MRNSRDRSWPVRGESAPQDALISGMPAARSNFADPIVDRVQAAILAADVAGYSRLMATDEWATVATLEAYRAVFRERVTGHRGRIVDTAGDSVLAIFPCAISAVEAALGIQEELDDRNKRLPQHLRMRFRLGVNFGVVIEKNDGTIYGLDVNLAAHIESLAEPGGTAISEGVHRRVVGKVGRDFQDIGEHQVKNLAKLVRAFSATPGPAECRRGAQAREARVHA